MSINELYTLSFVVQSNIFSRKKAMHAGDSSVYVDKAGLFSRKTNKWEIISFGLMVLSGILLALQV